MLQTIKERIVKGDDMKEELIRVLTRKRDDIKRNIESLVELNRKIDLENEKLSYVREMLEIFKEGEEYNIFKFVRLGREDFEKIIGIVGNDIDKAFAVDGCSYDGLTYLINGINNGVALSLTDDQKNAIEYLIRGFIKKEEEYEATIDGLLLVKTRFEVDDVEKLNKEKELYDNIFDRFDRNDYVYDTTKICEAFEFNELNNVDTMRFLAYILEYNEEVFKEKDNIRNEKVVEEKAVIKEENNEATPEKSKETTEDKEERVNDIYEKFTFRPFYVGELKTETKAEEYHEKQEENVYEPPMEMEDSTFDKHEEVTALNEEDSNTVLEPTTNDEISFEDTYTEVTPSEVNETEVPFEDKEEKVDEIIVPSLEEEKQEEVTEEIPDIPVTVVEEEPTAPSDVETAIVPEVDNDFKDVVVNNDYENDEKTSTRELQRLFNEYDLKGISIEDELLNGNADNYKLILDVLKKNDLLEFVTMNTKLLKNILISSDNMEVEEVLRIIKEDLSVDKEDYKVTAKIALSALPTIFMRSNGNYDNFIKNVALFKKIGINLINLFDFSKEVFVVDNELVEKNYEIVKKYNVEVDYKNAKYLLVIPHVEEKMDYYVESVYPDQTKNDEKFDGIAYINNYAVKLNTVSDLTIKRLRFASESGHKVFGSKPNSLSGEITNLKVNVLDISDGYLNSFFNNEFDGITPDEVREYTKLMHNSSNVGNYSDELEMLEDYHKGLRYVINDINISYNKVVRIYNVLRSYGVENSKALHFAVCYNLVITKDEYNSLKNTISSLGGNA